MSTRLASLSTVSRNGQIRQPLEVQPEPRRRPHALVLIAASIAFNPNLLSFEELRYLARLIAEDTGQVEHPIYLETYAAALAPEVRQ